MYRMDDPAPSSLRKKRTAAATCQRDPGNDPCIVRMTLPCHLCEKNARRLQNPQAAQRRLAHGLGVRGSVVTRGTPPAQPAVHFLRSQACCAKGVGVRRGRETGRRGNLEGGLLLHPEGQLPVHLPQLLLHLLHAPACRGTPRRNLPCRSP